MKRLLCIALLLSLSACGPGGRSVESAPILPGETPAEPPDEPAAAPAEPDPWEGRTDLIAAPPPTKPGPLELPPTERFTLPNGLEVLIVEDHDLPVVSFSLVVKAGEWDEPRDKRALAGMTAEMLTKGTRRRKADQISEAIDYVGGSLTAAAGLDTSSVGCSVLAKDAQVCLDLLPDVVVNATFPEKEMGPVRDQLLAQVKQVRDNAQALGSEHFANALWTDEHVRGWPVTAETIQNISRGDLVAFHKTWFVPNNAILAVAGDVSPKEMKARLTKAFRRWRKGKVPEHKSYGTPEIEGLKVRLVDKPDQTQSHIFVGHLGIARSDPDYIPTILMNYTLGGGAFSSRLMKVIRSEGGKTYGARSSFEADRRVGPFQAYTFTRNAETLATLHLVLSEMKKMKESGPTPDELASAQSNVAGRYPLGFQSAAQVASAILNAELDGLDVEFVKQFPVKVAAASLEDVKTAARQHLHPQRAVIVIVGKAAEVEPQLEKAGLAYEKVGHLEPISTKEREAKAAAKAAPVDPKAAAEGRKLLDQALVAKGGEKKVAGIKALTYKGKVKLNIQGQELNGELVRHLTADSVRTEIKTPALPITVVVSPKGVWQRFGPQLVEVPEPMASQTRLSLWRDRDFILLRHKERDTVVQSIGKKSIDGTDYDAVRVARPDGSTEVTLLLDPKTHLIHQIRYEEQGESNVETYGDYKKVDGIQFAHSQKADMGQMTIEATITEVQVNPKLPADAFAKP